MRRTANEQAVADGQATRGLGVRLRQRGKLTVAVFVFTDLPGQTPTRHRHAGSKKERSAWVSQGVKLCCGLR